jgi:hypothetical protein
MTAAAVPYLSPLIASENPFAASICAAFTVAGCRHVCTPYPMCVLFVNAEFASETDFRFAVAEIACAINLFHRAGLVLHGLTSDNVFVDADGHIVIAELGIGWHPDADSQEVPDEADDWFAFGTILYARMDNTDEDGESLIAELLSAARRRRARFETIKTHRFFAGVDWDAVSEKRAGAPRLAGDVDEVDNAGWNNLEAVLDMES